MASAPADPGSLQTASGSSTSAHLRACTKDGDTMVGFALFGGHRGVAQRVARRDESDPWPATFARIQCFVLRRSLSDSTILEQAAIACKTTVGQSHRAGTQLTGCFGNEVGMQPLISLQKLIVAIDSSLIGRKVHGGSPAPGRPGGSWAPASRGGGVYFSTEQIKVAQAMRPHFIAKVELSPSTPA